MFGMDVHTLRLCLLLPLHVVADTLTETCLDRFLLLALDGS